MKKKGFTLVELLVTMTVIAVLAGLALVSYQGSRKTARDAKRKADLEQIRSALEMYRTDRGLYPAGSAGSDRQAWKENWDYSLNHPLGALKQGNYLAVVPIDPINAYTLGGFGTCGGAQFYSYWSDGATYYLFAIEETKGTSGCICRDDLFTWGKYQYCVTNP